MQNKHALTAFLYVIGVLLATSSAQAAWTVTYSSTGTYETVSPATVSGPWSAVVNGGACSVTSVVTTAGNAAASNNIDGWIQAKLTWSGPSTPAVVNVSESSTAVYDGWALGPDTLIMMGDLTNGMMGVKSPLPGSPNSFVASSTKITQYLVDPTNPVIDLPKIQIHVYESALAAAGMEESSLDEYATYKALAVTSDLQGMEFALRTVCRNTRLDVE